MHTSSQREAEILTSFTEGEKKNCVHMNKYGCFLIIRNGFVHSTYPRYGHAIDVPEAIWLINSE